MNRSNTSSRSFSTDQLRAALGDVGGPARPDYLPDIVEQAGRMRQRPAWTFLERWISMDSAVRREGVPRAVVVFASVFLLVALLAVGVIYVGSQRTQPERPPGLPLGIFEPAAGRIAFHFPNWGTDRGYDPGLWAVDPSAPSVSTLVPLGPEGDLPLGWSSDGAALLFMRDDLTDQGLCCPDHLYILRADATETQLNREAMYTSGATIAPDGSRVVFAAGDYRGPPGLFVIGAEGGRPVRIAEGGESPTFSPDGTQIAYLSGRPGEAHVWVASADGSNAHEILADEPVLVNGVDVFDLAWSPAGDRIAIGNSLEGHLAIYTFAPDGSDFTKVVTGGMNPYWSPDGSQIAYLIPDDVPPGAGSPGLAIADADGSNVREFGFAASGPWHPGTLETVDQRPVDAP
jgi:Tol biopolymer transport system component